MKKIIAAIITKDDRYFIAQRADYGLAANKWEFPGGKMEHGETDQECLKRELQEELGIEAVIGNFVASCAFNHKNEIMQLCFYYVDSYRGSLVLLEHQAMKWVTKDELLAHENLLEADRTIAFQL